MLRCLSRYAFLNFESKIGKYIYCLFKCLVKYVKEELKYWERMT
jgi:hypothetical protein